MKDDNGAEAPTTNLIAVVIAFNEEQMLPGCLESIYGKVDEIVVVDGAYRDFPHAAPHSTDATRAIAEAYGAWWIPAQEVDGVSIPWADEMEKRTAALVGSDGDWYVQVDADERLIGTVPELEGGQHYALRIHAKGREWYVMRIWQHRGWMRYEGAHNALWSDNRLIVRRDAVRVNPAQARLLHLRHLRSAPRLRDKATFLPGRRERERDYRRTHGL